MSQTDVNIKANPTVAKFFDLGQRLFSLFLANALPAITGGAVLGVSVTKAAALAGFMAVIQVVQKLAAASTDGELTSEEIAEAFGKAPGKKK
jgi:ABC-type sulfate transport system permease subunit